MMMMTTTTVMMMMMMMMMIVKKKNDGGDDDDVDDDDDSFYFPAALTSQAQSGTSAGEGANVITRQLLGFDQRTFMDDLEAGSTEGVC